MLRQVQEAAATAIKASLPLISCKVATRSWQIQLRLTMTLNLNSSCRTELQIRNCFACTHARLNLILAGRWWGHTHLSPLQNKWQIFFMYAPMYPRALCGHTRARNEFNNKSIITEIYIITSLKIAFEIFLPLGFILLLAESLQSQLCVDSGFLPSTSTAVLFSLSCLCIWS